jgi:hypothetical protein
MRDRGRLYWPSGQSTIVGTGNAGGFRAQSAVT